MHVRFTYYQHYAMRLRHKEILKYSMKSLAVYTVLQSAKQKKTT